MSVKEKLVELQGVITCPNAICNFCEHFKNKHACEQHKKEVIADHMISNGVTVQEWISVKDRLPEDDADVIAFCYYHEKFQPLMCYLSARHKGEWFTTIASMKVHVTHWMPMPQPPEGE